jgi:outer membrane protein assembly factor BamB
MTATIDVVFKCNLQKCIDASPTMLAVNNATPLISVGSHSHQLVNLNSEHGEIVSKFLLADRIESQVQQFQTHYAVVGCYGGFLYCLDILEGSVRWKYASNGMIKCQPLVLDEKFIIFGNYNAEKNLYCLNEVSIVSCHLLLFNTNIFSLSVGSPCLVSNGWHKRHISSSITNA